MPDQTNNRIEEKTRVITEAEYQALVNRAGVFNVMLGAMKESQDKALAAEKEKFEIMKLEQQKMRLLLRTLTNGIALFDQEKKVTITNPAMMKLTGLPQEGFYLSELTRLFEKGKINIEEKLEEAFARGETTHIEEVPLLNFFYEIFITPVVNTKGEIVGGMVVLYDITHVKEIERAEAEFISTASHQLRTPMVGIQWVIERFLKKEKLTKQGKEYLEDIHTSVQRLSNLIDILLNVSRIEGGRVSISPQPLELVGFIKGYLGEVEPLRAKKNLNLIFKKHPPKLNVITDSSALRNIVQSVVSNALEYTPLEGKIEVSLEKQGSNFIFTVKDTGIGIPKEEQATIFDKFTRGSNAKLIKTDGTGLGVYIAKQAVELLGGKIWLESKVSKGTTFYTELPIESRSKKGGKKLT